MFSYDYLWLDFILEYTHLAKKPLSHYVPKFSNKYWADDSNFMSYFSGEYTSSIKKEPRGYKQWGRVRGLYSWDVEHALDRELETKVAPIYGKLAEINELNQNEKLIWAQFILSQLVRTPSFIKYEQKAKELSGKDFISPKHDRVGCAHCLDLNYIKNRDWMILIAHDDDYFVRTDNPVLLTGFVEKEDTCLYYPLTPKICFVACSMHSNWDAFEDNLNPTLVYNTTKGWAHMLNFYLAKCAGQSLILSPDHDGLIADNMFKQVLGIYPQPPFLIHKIENIEEYDSAYKSILHIMSEADNYNYPEWNVADIHPIYQI
ncbi:DUF4238 domain-containing protein [Photobacterium phosphoreum]|uniref:DUF4238 domain-containing protein n=1 Tax=Photobacterium phosphoreum TaxID=659 RepID=A0AAW4ZSP7_PHOPO|nr:DUF4238 domain-containing protein [Photobacterium phosphoreum]MCF2189512.1 DUF4238 domain-containing protein [Photobacterium phosphoreum]MCF2301418.1 DUF4238 domain-containing protein [Photobacterium phosphoreum]